jgi:glycosyltransferase involved in cell wall biosynthesis
VKVLHVLNGVSGGAARSVAELVTATDRLGVESFAICHDPRGVHGDEREAVEQAFGDRIVYRELYRWNRRIRSRRVARPLMAAHQWLRTGGGWSSARAVADHARVIGADLLHTNTFTTPDGAIAAAALGLPHVWHVRELIGADEPFRFYGGTRGFAQIAPGSDFVVNSPATRSRFIRLVPGASTHLVPNGLELSAFLGVASARDAAGSSSGGLVVGMVANLTSTLKGHDQFVDAAVRCGDLPSVTFRLYGADPVQVGGTARAVRYAEHLHRRVEQAGLADRFTFAGYCGDPVQIMREIDLLVLPNEKESFGRVAVEAMAAGACVVAADSEALRFVLDEGKTGVLVPARDPAAIADAIRSLAADAGERRRLAEAGAARAVEAFSIERCAGAVVDVYRTSLERSRPASSLSAAWARAIPLRAFGVGG